MKAMMFVMKVVDSLLLEFETRVTFSIALTLSVFLTARSAFRITSYNSKRVLLYGTI